MNQDKLEVVKQMARVDIDILGISGLKWARIDLIQITSVSIIVGKNPLEEMG